MTQYREAYGRLYKVYRDETEEELLTAGEAWGSIEDTIGDAREQIKHLEKLLESLDQIDFESNRAQAVTDAFSELTSKNKVRVAVYILEKYGVDITSMEGPSSCITGYTLGKNRYSVHRKKTYDDTKGGLLALMDKKQMVTVFYDGLSGY